MPQDSKSQPLGFLQVCKFTTCASLNPWMSPFARCSSYLVIYSVNDTESLAKGWISVQRLYCLNQPNFDTYMYVVDTMLLKEKRLLIIDVMATAFHYLSTKNIIVDQKKETQFWLRHEVIIC